MIINEMKILVHKIQSRGFNSKCNFLIYKFKNKSIIFSQSYIFSGSMLFCMGNNKLGSRII